MWVSQSYLTNLTADGAVMAYYLFESYREDHRHLETFIRPKLAQLARSLGDDAHLFVPTDEDRGSIEREFNDFLHQYGLKGINLPGILILDRSMGDEHPSEACAEFISFEPLLKDASKVDCFIEQVKRELLTVKDELESKKVGLERALANVQLRPSIWGVGYDLKPFMMRLLRKRRA